MICINDPTVFGNGLQNIELIHFLVQYHTLRKAMWLGIDLQILFYKLRGQREGDSLITISISPHIFTSVYAGLHWPPTLRMLAGYPITSMA
jgi:hypothetical protein